ncbi:sigma-70 family RNA polymerase sigma factor [Bacillus sp. FJAT-47783]|uniref:RNA polymerase sigma factor n=1 Tax=Bacillus sp. FJAT-47783 TaxID=2922712 RepID=UPI001FAD22E0|nr:sigma-70 family RNA polymerase sigma factor [Bacillus sp. FJAT-47783]
MKLEQTGEEMYQHIYTTFYNRVLHVAHSITKDFHLAEDVLQETFLKIYQHLDQMKDVEKLGAWIATITMRTAIDLLRKEKKYPKSSMEEIIFYLENPDASTEDMVWTHLLKEEIEQQIDRLKPEYRQVIELRYHKGLKEKEIETELNITKSTVKTRLYRARQTLKSQIAL